MEYVRIGTTYYKKVRKPLASGDVIEFLVPWSIDCIKQDHGKHFLSTVARFDVLNLHFSDDFDDKSISI